MKIIGTAFKGKDIREIKVSEIRLWVASFSITPKTVSAYMTNFRGIFDIAIEEEVLNKNPFIHIRKPKSKELHYEIGPFGIEEVELILKHAPNPLKNYLAISFYTGMRSGEVVGLQIKDIRQEEIEVGKSISKGICKTPKTIKSISSVPLFDALKPYIQDQVAIAKKKKTIWLFSNGDEEHLYGADIIRGKKTLWSMA